MAAADLNGEMKQLPESHLRGILQHTMMEISQGHDQLYKSLYLDETNLSQDSFDHLNRDPAVRVYFGNGLTADGSNGLNCQ